MNTILDRHDCRDYIDQARSKFKNIHKSYKIIQVWFQKSQPLFFNIYYMLKIAIYALC